MNVLLLYIIILVSLLIVYCVNEYIVPKEGFERGQKFIQGDLPESYYDEVKARLMKYFNTPSNIHKNFTTRDNKYKCSFRNHLYRNNLMFQKTTIDENDNNAYTVDTTKCGSNISDENCNKDSSINVEKNLFYKNNQYIDYDDEKYDIFLKGYELVPESAVNRTFTKSYEICKPEKMTYQFEDDFVVNYPCGVLTCATTNIEEQEKNSYDYDNLNEISKGYFDEIMSFEYKGKMDNIMQSMGYQYWIDLLNTEQSKNKEIMDYEPTL